MRSFLGLSLLAIVSSVSAQTYEAEDGALVGALYVDSEVPGYTGTGYVTGFTGTNDTLTIAVTEATAGSYDITVVYNAQYGSKYTDISVDGGAAVQVSIPNITTETWATSCQHLLSSLLATIQCSSLTIGVITSSIRLQLCQHRQNQSYRSM